jgi:Mn2+/Fe2+ NRAMP family transporter
MSLVFLGYIVSLFFATRLERSGRRTRQADVRLEHAFLFTFVAVIGTTISPYMQVFVQSSSSKKA